MNRKSTNREWAVVLMLVISLAFSSYPVQASTYSFLEIQVGQTFENGTFFEGTGSLTSSRARITSIMKEGKFQFTVPVSNDPWELALEVNQRGAEKGSDARRGEYFKKENAGTTYLMSSNWIIKSDMTIKVNIPIKQVNLNFQIVDAMGNPVKNSLALVESSGSISFVQNGVSWSLRSSAHPNIIYTKSPNGEFQYVFYAGQEIGLFARETSDSNAAYLPGIMIKQEMDFRVCLPINFPAQTRSLPDWCFQTQLADIRASEAKAKQEAEAKAKAEAEAKAAAELKAKQEAETAAKVSVVKKKTITCLKGKTVKKVKAVNPKCPKGYKKK